MQCSLEYRRKKIADESYTDIEAEAHAKEVNANPRPKETKEEIDERGAFIRQANYFITPFGNKEGELKAEKNKYIIFWAHGCNWSNRPLIARDILGLEDVIADYAVTHTGETNTYGWGFRYEKDHREPLTKAYFLSEFYKNADPSFKGRATTPTLASIDDKKALNNDYHRLSNYIEVQFRAFQKKDAPDLYPVKFRKEIDELNDWLFPHVNNGHYRMAFCQSAIAYEEAYLDFFESLEKLDKRLETNRFLFGDYITDSDIRLYVTLVRWETSYFKNVGPMKKRITEYKNIFGYIKDLYSVPEFRKYTFFEFPKKESESIFAPYIERIAPLIDFDKLWSVQDPKRKEISKHPNDIYLRHPENESVEDYQSEISKSIWNSKNILDRNPKNGVLSVDASINPLKDLL